MKEAYKGLLVMKLLHEALNWNWNAGLELQHWRRWTGTGIKNTKYCVYKGSPKLGAGGLLDILTHVDQSCTVTY